MSLNTLRRKEILKSKIQIRKLFEEGNHYGKYPLKMVFLWVDNSQQEEHCLFIPIVSARRYKKAVTRNRIKRVVRESYRLNKKSLIPYLTENNKKCILGVMYNANEKPTFEKVDNAMVHLLNGITKKV